MTTYEGDIKTPLLALLTNDTLLIELEPSGNAPDFVQKIPDLDEESFIKLLIEYFSWWVENVDPTEGKKIASLTFLYGEMALSYTEKFTSALFCNHELSRQFFKLQVQLFTKFPHQLDAVWRSCLFWVTEENGSLFDQEQFRALNLFNAPESDLLITAEPFLISQAEMVADKDAAIRAVVQEQNLEFLYREFSPDFITLSSLKAYFTHVDNAQKAVLSHLKAAYQANPETFLHTPHERRRDPSIQEGFFPNGGLHLSDLFSVSTRFVSIVPRTASYVSLGDKEQIKANSKLIVDVWKEFCPQLLMNSWNALQFDGKSEHPLYGAPRNHREGDWQSMIQSAKKIYGDDGFDAIEAQFKQ